jgi:hypothetical protein
MSEFFFVDKLLEEELLDDVCGIVKDKANDWHSKGIEAKDVGVFCVSPDYSSIVAMRVLHSCAIDRKLPSIIAIDTPFPKETEENKEKYKIMFSSLIQFWKQAFKKIILVEVNVLTGKNFEFMLEALVDNDFKKEDIFTVALVEMESSVFKCDLTGKVVKEMPHFWWEADIKDWD